jgi:hypothetical protein
MPNQPTPVVDMDDVERVVRREYPVEMVADILRRIDAVDVREKPRVVLACLKVAKGDRRRLDAALSDAPGYWREILSEAEYPLATKRWSAMDRLSDEQQSAIYERDWNQYVAWLGRNASRSPK